MMCTNHDIMNQFSSRNKIVYDIIIESLARSFLDSLAGKEMFVVVAYGINSFLGTLTEDIMEKYQSDLILANLSSLVRLTSCTSSFLSFFQEEGIFSFDDLEHIATLINRNDQASVFYRILVTRRDSFKALIDALEITGQTGALYLLQNYDVTSEKDLHDFVNHKDPLTIKVKRPLGVMRIKDTYKLPTRNKGYLLLINILHFDNKKISRDGNPYREGAELDGRYMTELWQQMGYEVYTDDTFKGPETQKLTRDEILDLIRRFKLKCERFGPASIVVFIGSHGAWNTICTSDPADKYGGIVTLSLYEEIFSAFSHNACPVLRNKPKLFFVNTCQDFISPPSRNRTDPIHSPPYSDAIICKSQVPGHVSNRDIFKGSHFVYCLAHVLMTFAREKSFQEMMDKLKLMMKNLSSVKGPGQVVSVEDVGMEQMYFYLDPETN